MSLCGVEGVAIHGQSREGGLISMAQWTSAVGAAQLARLLTSQQDRPAGPGTRRPPAYRALADGVRLLVLEGRGRGPALPG
ncbi:PLP-dependent aminotransferase family protein, partial [Streptomyces bobili]